MQHFLRLALAAIVGIAILAAPRFGNSVQLTSALILIAIFAVATYGLDIMISDLGEVSLAQPVFFGIGAYAAAMLSTRLGWGGWATLGSTIALALAFAGFLGLITLRLRDFAFSLVTYAVTVVAGTLAYNWSFLGASDGVRGVPPLDLSVFGLSLTAKSDIELWPYAVALLLFTLYAVRTFRRSKLGEAAIMSHLNPRLAVMSGINPELVRLQVFVVSAPITAMAGWLYAYQRSFVSSDVMEMYFLIIMLTACVFIGRRLLFAPLIGVAVLQAQEKFLSFGAYVDKIIVGSILILILTLAPGGVAGLIRTLRSRYAERAKAGVHIKA